MLQCNHSQERRNNNAFTDFKKGPETKKDNEYYSSDIHYAVGNVCIEQCKQYTYRYNSP